MKWLKNINMYLTYNVKDYFDKIVNFDNKKVLDFGCNHANFLLGTQNFASYTGLDIDKEIIENNIKLFPQHKWLWYKNYNWQYNPFIETDTIWPEFDNYDIGIAYSVFTHTDFLEFKNTVEKLKLCTKDLLITFLSSNCKNTIKEVLQHRTEYFDSYIDELVELIHNKKIINLLVSKNKNQVHLYENQTTIPKSNNVEYMLTFYDEEWIINNLGGEIVDVTNHFDGILGTQKCLKFCTHH